MTVTPVNDNPVATDDLATVAEDSAPTAINVLANDTFAPDSGETLTVTAVTQGSAGGTVTFTATGVSYTPAANFTGSRQLHLHDQRRQRRRPRRPRSA